MQRKSKQKYMVTDSTYFSTLWIIILQLYLSYNRKIHSFISPQIIFMGFAFHFIHLGPNFPYSHGQAFTIEWDLMSSLNTTSLFAFQHRLERNSHRTHLLLLYGHQSHTFFREHEGPYSFLLCLHLDRAVYDANS